MGLRINTNVSALRAQNNLAQTGKKLSATMERLSTGLRINRGADDVVGLFKSEGLRSNIRGITVAEQNISGASNLLGVAEGGLAQLTDLTQSIREKVVQAADATISSADRSNITTSINDLLSEYSRLVAASSFNGIKLLDGTFTNKAFQVGSGAADQISTSITNTASSYIGQIAIKTIAAFSQMTAVAVDFTNITTITIGSTAIGVSSFSSDGVSNVESTNSAIAVANAINSVAGAATGVTATALANVVTLNYSNTISAAFGGTYSLVKLNGVSLGLAGGISNSDGDAQTVTDAINSVSIQTGVSATIDTTANTIVLNASDGRNIDFQYINSNNANDSATNFMGVTILSQGSASNIGFRSSVRLSADSSFTITDATSALLSTSGSALTVSLTSALTLSTLNVSSVSNAQTGLFILDNVIKQLQTRRTDVGSKVNRFNTALAEIQTRKENLTTAESTIRDADIAKETADLTSAQVLQQAGTQVLAKANSLPQIALELLKNL
ncbi:MAG: hypothetical protein HQM15_06040 [Deltaproteobacteria bacterium]|nr:hypothetical protein [Deltaproteobacteria bacterium]